MGLGLKVGDGRVKLLLFFKFYDCIACVFFFTVGCILCVIINNDYNLTVSYSSGNKGHL